MAYQVQTASFNRQEALSHLRAATGAYAVGDLCGLYIWKSEATTRALLLPEPDRSYILAMIGELPEVPPSIVDTSCMSPMGGFQVARLPMVGVRRHALGSNGATPAAPWVAGNMTADSVGIDTSNTYQMLGLAAFAGIIGLLLFAGRKEHKPRKLTVGEAKRIGRDLGIDWATSPFSPEELKRGIEVEMEHGPGGPAGPRGDVTLGDLAVTAQIALAHLAEHPRYYDYLEAMEKRFEHGLEPNQVARRLVGRRAHRHRNGRSLGVRADEPDGNLWRRVAPNGPAADAEWLVHESSVALDEAEECWKLRDVECAQTKGQEARELARTALVTAHAAWPWQRGGAEKRAQQQYDEAHDFLWETFWAQRRTA